MYRLAILVLATSTVAGNPLHHNAKDDRTVIITFDHLSVKDPHDTTSIGIYNGLNFSNIWVDYQDSVDGTGPNASASYETRPSSRNKVGIWRGEVGKSPPLFGTTFPGSDTNAFDLKSFKWGCAPENDPCDFFVTGRQAGGGEPSELFGQIPGGDRFGTAFPDSALFSNLESVYFDTDPLDKTKVHGDVWIDEIVLVMHRHGLSTPSTSTTAAPTKTRPLPHPALTKAPAPLRPLPPVINCPDVCIANTDDCGQTWGGCFEFCLSPWPSFPPPTVCTITSGGSTTTGEVTATTVIIPTTASSQASTAM